jgi:hypothetical protein
LKNKKTLVVGRKPKLRDEDVNVGWVLLVLKYSSSLDIEF